MNELARKKYPCAECGGEHTPEHMWVWEDDKLRCSACTNRRMDKMNEYASQEDRVETRH